MAVKITKNSAAGQIYCDRRSSLRAIGENTKKLLFLAYKIRMSGFKYG